VFTICQIKSGHTFNVFPDEAFLQGTIRSYDKPTLARMKERIRQIVHSVAKGFECSAEVELQDQYPAVVNHKEQTEHVIRLAKAHFGEAHFSQDELPMAASEDFSFFLEKKPGCFFALGTMKVGQPLMTLHTSTYDFNDDMLASGAFLFLKIVEDRLQVDLLSA
jgi:hippurate hydrolase